MPVDDLAFLHGLKTVPTGTAALIIALNPVFYLAVPCTLVAYAGWIWALKRLPAREVAAFVFLNPPLANLWAWLFDGATLEPPFLLGAAVLLAGVAGIVLPQPGAGGARSSETPA